MKINDNIYVLKLKATMNPNEYIYPVLIAKENRLLLIDTGNPGQIDDIKKAIEEEGLSFQDLSAIVITHQDIDHVGCVKDILNELPNVKVFASENEARYINGTKMPTKVANLERNLNYLPNEAKVLYEKMKNFYSCNKVEIDEILNDGDLIPGFNEVSVIYTPGHTPGHLSLYIEEEKVLIAGDAFIIKDGNIRTTDSDLNFNDEEYYSSLKKLHNYDIREVVCYHGGIYKKNINKAIKDIINI